MKLLAIFSGERKFRTWLAALLLFVFLAGMAFSPVFEKLGVAPLHPPFADLIAILAAGEAKAYGLNIYLPNPLDPLGRPHVYGPWWLWTAKLGLVRADAWWLGLLLAGMFIVAAVHVLSPRTKAGLGIAALLVVSPPVLLGLERANNDLVIFLLLGGGAWLLVRRSGWGMNAGAALWVVAAVLKLYPAVALPAVFARDDRRRRLWFGFGMATVALTALVAYAFAEYRMAAQMAPQPITIFAHGLKLSYLVWAWMEGQRGMVACGAVPVLIFIAVVLGKIRGELWRGLPLRGGTTAAFLAGGVSWLFCYISTTNFPYRFILLLLPARWWLKLAERSPGSRWAWGILGLWLVPLWSPWVKNLVLVTEAGAYQGAMWPWIYVGAEHAITAGIAVVIGITAMGWAVRWLQAAGGPGNNVGRL